MNKKAMTLAILFGICLMSSPASFAGEEEFKIHKSADIKTLLQEFVGKRIIINLDSGQEISGVVRQVGDHLVQLSEPPRREFYDVIIRIDRINSFMIRVRGR